MSFDALSRSMMAFNLSTSSRPKFDTTSGGLDSMWADLWERICMGGDVFSEVFIEKAEDGTEWERSRPISFEDAVLHRPMRVDARLQQILLPTFYECFRDVIVFFDTDMFEEWMQRCRDIRSMGVVTAHTIALDWEMGFAVYAELVRESLSGRFSGGTSVANVIKIGGAQRGITEAREVVRRAAEVNPQAAQDWMRIDVVLQKMGKLTEALQNVAFGGFRAMSGHRTSTGRVAKSQYRKMGGRFY
jgi:hypothetical protein